MLKKLLLTSAIAALPSLAMAQTFAPDMPIIGGSSYCFTTVNGVCTRTIPAGPAATGIETLPADTNVGASGIQSGKIPVTGVGGGLLVYNAPLTGASITLTNAARQLILEPAGTIATLTVVFPAATTLINGQRIGICTTQIVTALTITPGTGTTVSNTVTAMLVPVATGAASCIEFIYRTANTNWYRTQ